jgi:hypothetical protein
VSKDDQNIEITLVIGHEDLWFSHQNVFSADNLNLGVCNGKKHLGPDISHPVNHIFIRGNKPKGNCTTGHKCSDRYAYRY